jgi:hypothetical protein
VQRGLGVISLVRNIRSLRELCLQTELFSPPHYPKTSILKPKLPMWLYLEVRFLGDNQV